MWMVKGESVVIVAIAKQAFLLNLVVFVLGLASVVPFSRSSSIRS